MRGESEGGATHLAGCWLWRQLSEGAGHLQLVLGDGGLVCPAAEWVWLLASSQDRGPAPSASVSSWSSCAALLCGEGAINSLRSSCLLPSGHRLKACQGGWDGARPPQLPLPTTLSSSLSPPLACWGGFVEPPGALLRPSNPGSVRGPGAAPPSPKRDWGKGLTGGTPTS